MHYLIFKESNEILDHSMDKPKLEAHLKKSKRPWDYTIVSDDLTQEQFDQGKIKEDEENMDEWDRLTGLGENLYHNQHHPPSRKMTQEDWDDLEEERQFNNEQFG